MSGNPGTSEQRSPPPIAPRLLVKCRCSVPMSSAPCAARHSWVRQTQWDSFSQYDFNRRVFRVPASYRQTLDSLHHAHGSRQSSFNTAHGCESPRWYTSESRHRTQGKRSSRTVSQFITRETFETRQLWRTACARRRRTRGINVSSDIVLL